MDLDLPDVSLPSAEVTLETSAEKEKEEEKEGEKEEEKKEEEPASPGMRVRACVSGCVGVLLAGTLSAEPVGSLSRVLRCNLKDACRLS